jgi:ubiquinone/menaquinone biosynthesis C-methylase UbiE
MDVTQPGNDEQRTLWNGHAGEAWVASQTLLDQLLLPFEELLAAAVASNFAGRVLDIGCGTGSTTLAAARRLGPNGQCVGIDISAPMIAAACARAERRALAASFIVGDAQTHAFEPASFELLISRFGVMFFDAPERAFLNLRRAAKKGAELRFVAWRSAAENPFMTTAECAAAPLLPNLPARRPDGPGQFAFAHADHVKRILTESGWSQITLRPVDVACTMPEAALQAYVTRLGPLGLILPQVEEPTRSAVIERVREAFAPYIMDTDVRFTAACWLVEARA